MVYKMIGHIKYHATVGCGGGTTASTADLRKVAAQAAKMAAKMAAIYPAEPAAASLGEGHGD